MLPKVLCAIVVAYALSPIDLIPDFIPILGFVDDALLLPGLMWLAIKAMPPDLLAQCRQNSASWMQNGGTKPKSLAGAA
ncbi:YkvA family protein, partial [Salmonella enterica]|uniref:YkvA family protein n=1 Tax=Salmonella enterica TaxID=28901 RepID=UPI003FA6FA6D